MLFFGKLKIPQDEVIVLQYDFIIKTFHIKIKKVEDSNRITKMKSVAAEYRQVFGEMFRRLFEWFCLRLGREADKSTFQEDFVDEDLIGKPERMTHARWRASFGEDEFVLLAQQAEKTPPAPPADDEYSVVVGKVQDAWLVVTRAEVHDAPAAAAEEEDIPPTRSRRRVCRRRWAQRVAAKAVVRPRVGRAHRLTCR